ncbi:MAG TPA: hypothetical protein VG734_25765 [Lacunisphaera sp.]|nr:hypothetical protein [Lacunisphaera sp.]
MANKIFSAVVEPAVGIGVGLFIYWHVAKGAARAGAKFLRA